MKLANVNGRGAIVTEQGTLDIAEATQGRIGPDLPSCIAAIDELVRLAPSLTGEIAPIDESLLGPPSSNPGQIIAIGMNYRAHAAEMGLVLSSIPAAFAKFRSALAGPFGPITLPSTEVDHEVEMVLVIGKTTAAVTPENAWEFVAGITCGQDLSERVVQMAAGRQFALGKSYPGFAPIGPWMTTIDEFDDPNDIALGCSVDGDTKQDARTSDMVFRVPELLTALCEVITLEPGDLIFTGSPSGAGSSHQPPRYLKAGQELVTWLEGVGTMRHSLVAADKS